MSLFSLAAYGFASTAAYYLCPRRFRWIVLLLASYGFYASRAFSSLPFILVTTLSTWLGALIIGSIGEKAKARLKAEKATLTKEEKSAIKAKAKARQRVLFYGVLVLNLLCWR